MKNIIRIIKNNYKFIFGIIVGLIISISSVYAIEAYIESNKVSYNNHNKTNVEEAIDELYERSGIHKEKWVDPILNGADPILQDPLIPVEIKNDGTVYYANENSEWYNYSEKRWANAIILIDEPSKTYSAGDYILEKDIESYFVWIPRYQYKVWDLGNYTGVLSITTLNNTNYATSSQNAFNKSKLIDIRFGAIDKIPKMVESSATLNNYYTHPAFTLGDKDLNGLWVGKFETGYKGANNTDEGRKNELASNKIVIKPNVYSWRNNTIKNMFTSSYEYKNNSNSHNETLDPHMMKNTEWGAVAYLSHSIYGIGTEVRINNASDYKTGYSAATNTNQETRNGEPGESTDETKTQPWNTLTGYLASTTGNISGIYDMSGGAWEYVAACIKGNPGKSGFSITELSNNVVAGYIDEYAADCEETTYNKRILGDAIGEMGPFYQYYNGEGSLRNHGSWYRDEAVFVNSSFPWFGRGGVYLYGGESGQFYVQLGAGDVVEGIGFRIALAIQ